MLYRSRLYDYCVKQVTSDTAVHVIVVKRSTTDSSDHMCYLVLALPWNGGGDQTSHEGGGGEVIIEFSGFAMV